MRLVRETEMIESKETLGKDRHLGFFWFGQLNSMRTTSTTNRVQQTQFFYNNNKRVHGLYGLVTVNLNPTRLINGSCRVTRVLKRVVNLDPNPLLKGRVRVELAGRVIISHL